jgi:putative ABC transport system substrate-binding protein
MKRPAIVIGTFFVALLAVFPPVWANEKAVLRVGDVSLGAITLPTRTAFLERMAELGYERGRNFIFDYKRVQNRAAFAAAYREMVDRKVDILIAAGHEAGLKAAVKAAGDIPIVMVAIDYDPLAGGYVQSLSRPGRNVTGVFMKEAFPDVKAATVVWDWASADQWKVAQTAAAEIGYPVQGVEFLERPYDYESAFARVAKKFRGALLVPASPVWKFPKRRIVPDFALRHRIRSMYFSSSYVRAGGLMSYGVSFPKLFRRIADYVDKIVKGTKPQELPIERPNRFELVVNLKTAKALGITIPPSILLRADKVIE